MLLPSSGNPPEEGESYAAFKKRRLKSRIQFGNKNQESIWDETVSFVTKEGLSEAETALKIVEQDLENERKHIRSLKGEIDELETESIDMGKLPKGVDQDPRPYLENAKDRFFRVGLRKSTLTDVCRLYIHNGYQETPKWSELTGEEKEAVKRPSATLIQYLCAVHKLADEPPFDPKHGKPRKYLKEVASEANIRGSSPERVRNYFKKVMEWIENGQSEQEVRDVLEPKAKGMKEAGHFEQFENKDDDPVGLHNR